jgi:hypothetical protein
LSLSLVRLPIDIIVLAFANSNHDDKQNLIANFVDKTIPDAAKFDFVTVRASL